MIRIALRNLARNRWRSGLTLGGIAMAVATLAWTQELIEAIVNTTVAGATSVQMGEISIETKAHVQDGSIHDTLATSDHLLARVQGIPGVRAVAPRLYTYGLVSREARSQSVLFIGVDASAEAAASNVPLSVVDGSWLPEGSYTGPLGRPVVLGEGLARLLAARVGDELVALLQTTDGSMGDDRLRVVGVARTGTSTLDRQAAWMRRNDLAWLTAQKGQAHTLMVRIERGANVEETAVALRTALVDAPGPDLIVRTWQELAPDLYQLVQILNATVGLFYGLVFFVAALGILNVQQMNALERRRELAVMMAMGTAPARITGLLMLEMILLTALGAAIGVFLGGAMVAWHAYAGLNLAAIGSESHTNMGVSFPSRLYFVLRPTMIAQPALLLLVVSALSGMWPAIRSARLELVRAISGRT
jgi:ABC-type lipoprotein release transport system permease subunit